MHKLAAAAVMLTLGLASSASAAAPTITADSADEGEALTVAISHACGVKKCRYEIATVDGTATAGSDYVAVAQAGKVRKGATFQAALPVQTVDDAACEPAETFVVHVHLTRKGRTAGFEVQQTIVDNDCAGDSAPANPPGAQIKTQTFPDASIQTCLTSPTLDVTLAPCTVTLPCPTSATTCEATAAGGVAGLVNGGNGAVSASAAMRSERTDCAGRGTCDAPERTIGIAPGEAVSVTCRGTHDLNDVADGQQPIPDDVARLFCFLQVVYR